MLCISHCPRLLTDLSRQTRNIAFLAYAAQIYFFLVFGATECLLLTSMERGIKGEKIGEILSRLQQKVIEDPTFNTKAKLLNEIM